MKTKKDDKIVNEHDEWTCGCGNTAEQDGFYPCNAEGNEMEPLVKSEWAGLYLCSRCGAIINRNGVCVRASLPEEE